MMIHTPPTGKKPDRDLPYAVRIAAMAVTIAAAVAWAPAAMAQAQPYPSKALRLIVGYPPGGSTDIASRLIAVKLSERLRQPVIVENPTGGGGIVGVDTIAKAAPDGHTIGVGVSGMLVINAIIRKDLPYNPLTDLAPISMIFNNTLVLASNPSFPAKSVSELITMAKANPKGLAYGSSGAGTAMHLAGALLSTMTGAQLVHVPYRGGAPALQDLVAGQVPFVIVDVASARELVRAGRVTALATTGEQRALTAPNVPTVRESGVPGFAVNSWVGLVAPAQIPPAIVGLLNSHIVAILQEQATRDRFLELGFEPWSSTPTEFRNLIKSEIGRWDKFIKESGISFNN
jgi:tripartite-type tricarboxylate transporter receptor subunit TctC